MEFTARCTEQTISAALKIPRVPTLEFLERLQFLGSIRVATVGTCRTLLDALGSGALRSVEVLETDLPSLRSAQA
eukprot:4237915-Pleurochrysis_carterae.AAC.1